MSSNSHPVVRLDDLRIRPEAERKKLARDRVEAIKRLQKSTDYQIMMALRTNGLYSHRTNDAVILHTIKLIREGIFGK